MNKRIKELAEHAWASANPTLGQFHSKMDEINQRAFQEKFAELIVGECAGIALEQKKWVEDMKVHNPHDEHWNKARIQQSQRIVDKILEHFEVK